MVYETFLSNIQSLVQARFGGRADVTVRRVLKNNGLLLLPRVQNGPHDLSELVLRGGGGGRAPVCYHGSDHASV